MSADNWTQCPKCYVINREKASTLENLANLSYGRVSADEYQQKKDDALSFRKAISNEDNFTSTLREDYEIGVWSQSFQVSYHARCNTCGFEFTFNHEEKI